MMVRISQLMVATYLIQICSMMVRMRYMVCQLSSITTSMGAMPMCPWNHRLRLHQYHQHLHHHLLSILWLLLNPHTTIPKIDAIFKDLDRWRNILDESKRATIFFPNTLSKKFLRAVPSSVIKYHVLPYALSFFALQHFKNGTRFPTLMHNKSILITSNYGSDFTIDGRPISDPDMFYDGKHVRHGVPNLLNYRIYGGKANSPKSPPSSLNPPLAPKPPHTVAPTTAPSPRHVGPPTPRPSSSPSPPPNVVAPSPRPSSSNPSVVPAPSPSSHNAPTFVPPQPSSSNPAVVHAATPSANHSDAPRSATQFSVILLAAVCGFFAFNLHGWWQTHFDHLKVVDFCFIWLQ